MSVLPDPTEPRPELQRRQSIVISEADDVSSIIEDVSERVEATIGVIGDISSRIDEASSIVGDVSSLVSETSKETTSSTKHSSIPLTTIFTPNEDCTRDNGFSMRDITSLNFYDMDSGADKATCYPSSYREYQYRVSGVYYSPGVCPLSYVYVSTSVLTYGHAPDTTFATCCPRNAESYATDIGWSCHSIKRNPKTMIVDGTSTVAVDATYLANPIFVAWQESDLSRFSPQSEAREALQSAGVTFPTNTESGSSTSETESGNTQDGDSESGGGGLSTGAIAGIGVGAGIIGIMGIVAIWWFLKRYKISRRTSNGDERGQSWEQQIYEAPDTRKDPQQIHEAPNDTKASQQIYEAPGTNKSANKLQDMPKSELQG